MIREKMIRIKARGGTIMPLVLSMSFLVPKAAAQSDQYSKMAPVDPELFSSRLVIVRRRGRALVLQEIFCVQGCGNRVKG